MRPTTKRSYPIRIEMKRGGMLYFDPASRRFEITSLRGNSTSGHLSIEVDEILPKLPDTFNAFQYLDVASEFYPDCAIGDWRSSKKDYDHFNRYIGYNLSYLQNLGYITKISLRGKHPWEAQKHTPSFEALKNQTPLSMDKYGLAQSDLAILLRRISRLEELIHACDLEATELRSERTTLLRIINSHLEHLPN